MPITVGSEALAQWSIGFGRAVGHAFSFVDKFGVLRVPKSPDRLEMHSQHYLLCLPLIIAALILECGEEWCNTAVHRPSHALGIRCGSRPKHSAASGESLEELRRLKMIASRFCPTPILPGFELVHFRGVRINPETIDQSLRWSRIVILAECNLPTHPTGLQ